MFTILDDSTESRHRRGWAFLCGWLAQTAVLGGVVFLGLIFPSELPLGELRYTRVWLDALKPPQKPPVDPPPLPKRVILPKIRAPRIPAALELPPPVVARVEVPKIPSPLISPPKPEIPPPAPPVMQPPPPVQPRVEVHTGLFGGAPEHVTTKRPVDQVQTGGFGSPQGFKAKAQGDSAGNVPKLGAFGLPDGPGYGNGTGGAHGVQGVVASAGFGSGVAGGGYDHQGAGTDPPKVSLGGFSQAPAAAPSPAKAADPPPAVMQAVEILSKPAPVYTEEARRAGVQGEVTLSVIFQASGTVRVLGVVKSLGHGLDQAAEQAAAQIRFKPALRDGKPADFPATLRIQFRLADPSTS